MWHIVKNKKMTQDQTLLQHGVASFDSCMGRSISTERLSPTQWSNSGLILQLTAANVRGLWTAGPWCLLLSHCSSTWHVTLRTLQTAAHTQTHKPLLSWRTDDWEPLPLSDDPWDSRQAAWKSVHTQSTIMIVISELTNIGYHANMHTVHATQPYITRTSLCHGFVPTPDRNHNPMYCYTS